jgi:hypothetical protein
VIALAWYELPAIALAWYELPAIALAWYELPVIALAWYELPAIALQRRRLPWIAAAGVRLGEKKGVSLQADVMSCLHSPWTPDFTRPALFSSAAVGVRLGLQLPAFVLDVTAAGDCPGRSQLPAIALQRRRLPWIPDFARPILFSSAAAVDCPGFHCR